MTWKPGQSGNPKGRPKGLRDKLTHEFIRDLAQSWEKHGEDVLERLAKDDPASYAKLAIQLVPKELRLSHSVDVAGIIKTVAERQQQMLTEKEREPVLIEQSTDKANSEALTEQETATLKSD